MSLGLPPVTPETVIITALMWVGRLIIIIIGVIVVGLLIGGAM